MKVSKTSCLAILDVFEQCIFILDKKSGNVLSKIKDVGHPDGIQVDKDKNYIYWSDMGRVRKGEDFLEPDGGIYRCRLDGGEKKCLIRGGNIFTPKQIQIDRTLQKLYWCDREGAKVCSINTDGSNFELLIERNNGKSLPSQPLDQCVGIVIDKKKKHLYWTQKGTKKGGMGRIFRATISSLPFEGKTSVSNIITLLDYLPEPIDLAIDDNGTYLYWTDRGVEPHGNTLNRANIEDAGLVSHQVLLNGFKEAIGLAIDESYFYVSDLSGCVYRINKENLEMEIIYSNGKGITGITLF